MFPRRMSSSDILTSCKPFTKRQLAHWPACSQWSCFLQQNKIVKPFLFFKVYFVLLLKVRFNVLFISLFFGKLGESVCPPLTFHVKVFIPCCESLSIVSLHFINSEHCLLEVRVIDTMKHILRMVCLIVRIKIRWEYIMLSFL